MILKCSIILLLILFRFTDNDLKDLFRVLDAAAAVDGSAVVVLSDGLHHHHHHHYHQQQMQQQSYYGGSYIQQQQLTRLQDEILQCLETLERETLQFDDDECGGSRANSAPDRTHAHIDASTNNDDGDKKNSSTREQRQQLVDGFLCPLFDQLLKFCRFVCPPPTHFAAVNIPVGNLGVQQLSNGGNGTAVDHLNYHNKVRTLYTITLIEILDRVLVNSNFFFYSLRRQWLSIPITWRSARKPCLW